MADFFHSQQIRLPIGDFDETIRECLANCLVHADYRYGGMIMSNYDYFNQYKSEMERIKVKTAHDEHKVEFRDMCAKMISDAIPEIKTQIK